MSLLEIDDDILQIRNILSPLPQADPRRSTYLAILAGARSMRYELTDENEDMEESISRSVEAILSFDPHIGHDSHVVVTTFFFLADSLFRRSVKLKRLDDSKRSLRYFRYLRDQSLETPRVTRSHITTAFAQALANQVRMGSIDPTRNVEEMAILCCELLRLDASDKLLLGAVETLVRAIRDDPQLVDRPPPDQAIECLREANIRFPASDRVSLRLLLSLSQRFMMVTHSHPDYEEAMSIVDRFITDPTCLKVASYVAVRLAETRFKVYGNPEYLEEAIFRIQIRLGTLSSEDPECQELNQFLEKLEKARFYGLSVASNSRAVDAGNTEVNNHPSPLHLVPIPPITSSDIGELTPTTPDVEDPDAFKTLSHIVNQPISRARIEEAMECHRRYLESSPSSGLLTLMVNYLFAQLLIDAFRFTDDMAYLNKSITLLRDDLKSPVTPLARHHIIRRLISALMSRFERSREMVDFEAMIQLYSTAVADTSAKIPHRFCSSCEWATLARVGGHPPTSTAYESAVLLMKNTLAFSPTLEIQHYHLVSSRDDYETLPLDYASHQIDIGQLEQAVETLE